MIKLNSIDLDVRPLVANVAQTPVIPSSVPDKNNDQNAADLEHIQRLQELGIPDRDIHVNFVSRIEQSLNFCL